jgi:hypothetical protein
MPARADIQIRDPFVLVESGVCYLFGSTDANIWRGPATGFDAYRSDGGLEHWEGPFAAFRPPAGFFADSQFWAPECHPYGGAYYLFATFMPARGPRQGTRGTAVLRAAAPLGPYAPWSDGPVTPAGWQCLDGTLYVDADGPWLVFCHEWVQVADGQICALPLTADLRAAAGEPELLFPASSAPWAFPFHHPAEWARDLERRLGPTYVTDGPFLHRAGNGDLLLLWSSWNRAGRYCLGVATSESGTIHGPWRQAEHELYSADGGHGMVFDAPQGGLTLALHAPNPTPLERAQFIPLDEREGRLSLRGPGA